MPADTATLILRVRNDKYVRDMKKANGATKNLSGSASSLKKVLTGVGFAVAARSLARFGVSAVKAASKAEETASKFKTVFSDIPKLAEAASRSLAKSFNLAEVTTKTLLSGTGDLLVGFGFSEKAALDLSTQVNRLAIDLASFQNLEGGASRASEALTKALLGETESAKSLGIVIRQNTKEYRDEVASIQRSQGISIVQAKAINNLRIAYRQSTKALGDYGRTQDSVANVGRTATEAFIELKQAIGETTLELAKALKLVGGTKSLSTMFIGSRQDGVTRRQFIESLIEVATGMEDINEKSTVNLAAPGPFDLAGMRGDRSWKKYQDAERKYQEGVAAFHRREREFAEEQERKAFKLYEIHTKGKLAQAGEDEARKAAFEETEKQLKMQIRLQKLINAGKEKEAFIQEWLNEAGKLTQEQREALTQAAGNLYDVQNKQGAAATYGTYGARPAGPSASLASAMAEGSAEAFRTIRGTQGRDPEEKTAKNTESIDKTLKRSLSAGNALVTVNLGGGGQ